MAEDKKRVLVVEDSDTTRQVVVALLRKNARLEVDSAANATEALQKTKSTRPAVIVLDMMLPDMSGVEFIERLHGEIKEPLPAIVAITAAPQVAAPDAIIQAADRTMVRAIFRKPLDHDKLAAAVAEYAKA